MAEKQLDKLVANAIHSLDSYKLNRETLLLEFLRKDSAIDVAPSINTIANGDSLPFLKSSVSPSTPRTIDWINTVISNGRLVSIGGAEIRTDLSILNRNATTLDIASNTGDDATVPAATVSLAGLMTAAGFTKLGTIEEGADVTDKENVGAAILASPTKGTIAGTDYIAILDSTGNILSKIIWSSVTVDGSFTVNQSSHGFSVGDPIKPSLLGWVLTKADTAANAGTVGVVSQILDSGTFKYVTSGVVPGSYTIGADYFLSTTTLGDLMIVTGTEEWLEGQIVEYIGTGVTGGLHVNIEQGQEISGFLVVDKYVQAMGFDTISRTLTLERTAGLSDLEVVIPQYVEVDTLDSVLNRGNSSTLGATFGNTVTASKLSVFNGYDIEKVDNKMILSTPLQFEVNINNTSVLQVATGGNVTAIGSLTTPTVKLTSGATPDYIWKCTNVNGAGAWFPIAASNIYKGTWNATTNTPTLTNGVGTAGWYYRVTTAGTWNSIVFSVGDDIIYSGTVWERIPSQGFTLQPATAVVLGGVKIGSGVNVGVDGTISVSTNYQFPLNGTGLVYSTAGVITYDATVYASQFWVTTNYSSITHNHSTLYVPLTRSIITSGSLTGGGTLSADRTISLVNDSATPGINYLYGTSPTGTKGWFQRLWVPTTNGIVYSGGWVSIGSGSPSVPLHLALSAPSSFMEIINNIDDVTGNGLSISAGNIALEVKDRANYTNPIFQILGNGTIKWQGATTALKDTILYYDTVTNQFSIGGVPTLASLGAISLTSLSATSPIVYDNTTGVFSMITNAYAPYGTVSFPGFGTNHTTAAYGDHTHAAYEITAGTTTQYWRGDKTFQELTSSVVAEGTNLYFTPSRSRTSISLTTTGTTGTASYSSATGVLNIPNYSASIYVTSSVFSAATGVLTLTRANSTDLTTSFDGRYSLTSHTHAYEPFLGNPLVDGRILSSTVAGVRSWISPYSHPAYTTRSIDAGSGQVLDTFTSDALGHVTGIALRTLVELDIPAISIAKTTGLQTALDLKQPSSIELSAIAAISGSTGFLKRTGAGAWSIDSSTYLTTITNAMVLGAIGFTPEPALGLPASNGYVLSSTTAGVRSWIAISGSSGGTVTSIAAGVGMDFATFTTSGSIVLGTPSTINTSSANTASGTTHTHSLNLSGRSIDTQFSLSGGGTLGSDRILYLTGDVASPSANYYYGTDATATRGWYAVPYPSSLSFSSGTITMGRNGMSNLTVSLDGRYAYTAHTHTGVYDNYGQWYLYVNGANSYTVGTNTNVNLIAGTNVTISRSGSDVTIAASASGSMVYPGAGIAVSTGSAWGTSITNNSANWNTAYTDSKKVAFHDNTSLYGYLNSAYFDIVGATITPKRDSTPTASSVLPVTSGGVYTALAGKAALNGSVSQYFSTSELDLPGGWAIDTNDTSRIEFWKSGIGGMHWFYSSGNVTHSGALTASEVYRGSSREIKHDIELFNGSALEIICTTPIFTYKMNCDDSFAIGFIAEDTHPWMSGPEQKRHSFGNHLGLLTKAIQEENDRIGKLEYEVIQLQNKIIELEYGRG